MASVHTDYELYFDKEIQLHSSEYSGYFLFPACSYVSVMLSLETKGHRYV